MYTRELTVCTHTEGKKYEIISSFGVKEMSVSGPLIPKLRGASGVKQQSSHFREQLDVAKPAFSTPDGKTASHMSVVRTQTSLVIGQLTKVSLIFLKTFHNIYNIQQALGAAAPCS